MRQITLIRHARTEDNIQKRFSGKIESKVIMSREEIRQYILPKISVSEMGEIYSSPSQRAIFTAKAFAEDITINNEIREIDFGIFEGKTLDEIMQTHPQEFERWANSQAEYRFPQGDNTIEFCNRAVRGFQSILAQSDSPNITLFTHGGVIQALISNLLVGDNSLFWNFKIDNCSVTRFEWDDKNAIFKIING